MALAHKSESILLASGRPSRHEIAAGYAVVAGAAIVSVALGLIISAVYSPQEALQHDATAYWDLAERLDGGQPVLALTGPPHFIDVGYPALLAALFALFGPDVRAMQLANVAMFAMASVFCFLAIKKLSALLGYPIGSSRLRLLMASAFFFSPTFLTFSGKLYSEILAALGIAIMTYCILQLWGSRDAWLCGSFAELGWSILLIVGSFIAFVTKSSFFPLLIAYLFAFFLLRRRVLFSAMAISLLLVLPFQASAQRGGRGTFNFAIQVAQLNLSYSEIAAGSVYGFSYTLGKNLLPSYEGLFQPFNPDRNLSGYERNPYVVADKMRRDGFSYLTGVEAAARDPLRYAAVAIAGLPVLANVEGIWPDIGYRLPTATALPVWLVFKLSLSLLLWIGAARLVLARRREPLLWISALPLLVFVAVHSNLPLQQRWFFPLLPVLWMLALSYVLVAWPRPPAASEESQPAGRHAASA